MRTILLNLSSKLKTKNISQSSFEQQTFTQKFLRFLQLNSTAPISPIHPLSSEKDLHLHYKTPQSLKEKHPNTNVTPLPPVHKFSSLFTSLFLDENLIYYTHLHPTHTSPAHTIIHISNLLSARFPPRIQGQHRVLTLLSQNLY